MGELKPCPFCAGKAQVLACDASGVYFSSLGTPVLRGRKLTHRLVRCTKCGVRTKAYLTVRGLWNAWNRRAECA